MTKHIFTFLCSLMLIISGVAQGKPQTSNKQTSDFLHAVCQLTSGSHTRSISDIYSAKVALKNIIKKDPGNDAAYYYLGVYYNMIEDFDQAKIHLEKALAISPDNYHYMMELSVCYWSLRDYESVERILTKILENDPADFDAINVLFTLYNGRGDYDLALKCLSDLESEYGKTEKTVSYTYQVLKESGEDEKAEAVLKDFIEEYDSPAILCTLAGIYLDKRDYETAGAYFDQAMELQPNLPQALVGKMEICRRTAAPDTYFELLKNILDSSELPLELKSQVVQNQIGGKDSFMKTNFERFETALLNWYSENDEDVNVIDAIGLFYVYNDDLPKALEYLKRNAELHEDSENCRSFYIYTLQYSGDWELVKELSDKATLDFPNNPNFLEYGETACYFLNDNEGYMKYSRLMIDHPNSSVEMKMRAYGNLGSTLYKLGNKKEAYKTFDKALSIDPDYCFILNNYAYFLSMDGKKLKKALQMSNKTVEAEPDNSTYLDTCGWILHLLKQDKEAKIMFKRCMMCGGKEDAVILDHYAEVLYSLKDYTLAKYYWEQAIKKDTEGEIEGLEEKVKDRLGKL